MSSPRIHAPELDGAVDWLNVPAPLSLAALRGKVVLLDFWTYGCINCMHILPGLRRLEAKYRRELVVIGVHSAKFANERKSENIRHILVRYDIDHPVANDARFAIWRAYGARAWPTLVLIDPEGYVVATASGEGKTDALDRAIAAVIQVFDARGLIDRTPIALSPERERLATSSLAFPGKVIVDEPTSRLFIADSNHHRVLETDLDGRILRVIGHGEAGFANGAFEAASFYRPQGLALDGRTLYIADSENHAVRAADLDAGRVTTIAGTGRQAGWGAEGGAARETPLNSPWDLALWQGRLFVAMAGSHQIWVIDRAEGTARPFAGSGREARQDGGPRDAAFAQPSGLAASDDALFVADSESNIIRRVDPSGAVRTIAGGDLFEFGDRDDTGDAARFQHPLGVAWLDGRLFVADTYNHKVRTVDPATQVVRTFAGTGEAGLVDDARAAARFYEPGGIAATRGALYVADTNNHAIRRIALDSGRADVVTTLHVGER
jgi:thiol-disulfide isomerase/thioredoxin/sugar lactone lactonase YvrE